VAPEEAQIEARLRKAAELAPRQVESQTALGLYLLDKGVLDEAESRLHKALEFDPDSRAAKNGLAVVYYENALRDSGASQDFLRRGLALLREADRESPNDLQITFNLAMFYHQLGFIDRARVSWTKYLKLDPDSEWAEVAKEKLEELQGS
jgi:Flp pilus assembly protein TadD